VKPSPEQESAQNKVHDLLASLAAVWGPGTPGSDDDLAVEDEPEGAVFLSEWVVVAAWVDETGKNFVSRYGSPSLPGHHMKGLLHDGLFGFED
jgi:hypothetical protein